MPSLRPLASISCRIISIHVFFGLPCALLTYPKLIRSTCRTGTFVGLRRTLPNHRRRFSLIFSSIEATPILVRKYCHKILDLLHCNYCIWTSSIVVSCDCSLPIFGKGTGNAREGINEQELGLNLLIPNFPIL